MGVEHLTRAKANKDDEYYTRKEDVEKIVDIFADDLRGKVVYCNCDVVGSWFVRVLKARQQELGIKEVLHSSTDYASEDKLPLLERCDIVMTNPPFSKMLSYIPFLLDHDKDFIIIAHNLTAKYSQVMPLLNSKIYALDITISKFTRPDGSIANVQSKVFTTLSGYSEKINKRIGEPSERDEENEATYIDKYDAWNVDRITLINKKEYKNYKRYLVPITFLYKADVADFDVLGVYRDVIVDEKRKFDRILIERNK